MHVSRRAPGPAWRRAVAAALVTLSCTGVAGGAHGADAPPPPAAEPAPSPAPASPAESADVAKAECVANYEHAQVARQERRLMAARASLRVCSGVACPSAIRADCVDWLEQVARSMPSVVVTARARGADVMAVKVFIDGKLATETLSGFALEIDPGLHTFRFESPPWPAIEREVLANEGVKERPIEVEFAPPLPDATRLVANADEPRPFRLERSDYVFGGIAVAGVATLATFGGTGLYDAHHLKQTCMSYCAPDDVDAVRTKLVVADVGLAVAVISLAVGLYLHGKAVF